MQKVSKVDYDRIEAENYLIREQLKEVQEILFLEQEGFFASLANEKGVVHAKVVYRDPHIWGSFLWVNKGSKANHKMNKEIIQKNSPVLMGNKLVGIVEEVLPSRSKIRLITDEALRIAVCSYRGKSQDREIESSLLLLEQLVEHEDPLFAAMQSYRKSRSEMKESGYITRGEIFGASLPLWKTHQMFLKGRGFHSVENPYKHDPQLFCLGDLLFTSGMDGLFPEGLFVGTIHSISPLTEGAYHYQIEAMPALANLRDVTYVTILPILGSLGSE
jgi:cell shape-determining protein MreC